MAYNTVIQQGEFTSDQTDYIIPLRSDVDWVEVRNLDNIAGATQWDGLTWYWQRGMNNDDAILTYHVAADQTVSASTSATGFNGTVMRGISLIDTSDKTPGAAIAVTAGTNATTPVYNTANTGVIAVGSIVRVVGTDQRPINGLDFTVSAVTADTNFTLGNTLATAPGVAAGAAGFWRYVAPNVTVYNMFTPKKRIISNITQAAAGVVTTLVDHAYTTGDAVRIAVPPAGVAGGTTMTELDGQLVTVTVIDAATFSIDVNTTGYTAFTFPTDAQYALGRDTDATVTPVGVDPANNTSVASAVRNTAFIGIILGTSAGDNAVASGSPGGSTGDVLKWRAGKSFAADVVGI